MISAIIRFPEVVVADSSFILEALIDSGQSRHQPARDFADRLRRANLRLVYSLLLFLEAPQCWRRLYARGALVPSHRVHDRTEDRLYAFAEADLALQTFLASYNTQRMPVTRRLLRLASTEVAKHNLRSMTPQSLRFYATPESQILSPSTKTSDALTTSNSGMASSFYSGCPNLVEISTEHG